MADNEAERKRWNDEDWTDHWPKRERLTDAVTGPLVDALALRPGERVLDVGSGGGKAALRAARDVGRDGSVVGADISGPLSTLATRRASEAGLTNVTFQVADVQSDPIDGRPFDAAMSQFGVMFFDDPVAAFTNIRGHLRAGGRLAFACWQGLDRNPWFFGIALAGLMPPPSPSAPGKSPTGPFAFADPDHVRAILDEAGFRDIAAAQHNLAVEAAQDSVVDDAQLRFMGIPEDKLAEASAAVDRHMAQFVQPSGLSRFPIAFQIFSARNAAS